MYKLAWRNRSGLLPLAIPTWWWLVKNPRWLLLLLLLGLLKLLGLLGLLGRLGALKPFLPLIVFILCRRTLQRLLSRAWARSSRESLLHWCLSTCLLRESLRWHVSSCVHGAWRHCLAGRYRALWLHRPYGSLIRRRLHCLTGAGLYRQRWIGASRSLRWSQRLS